MMLWLFSFLAAVVLAQNQLPYNTSVYAADVPVFVSPCGVAVVSFKAVSAVPNFFWTMTFTAITPVPWIMRLSLKAPQGSNGAEDYKQCNPQLSCRNLNSSSCTIVNGCGDQARDWYAYVETTGLDAGQFSLHLDVYPYPTPIVLSIDDSPSVQNFTTFGGFPLGAAGFTLSQYDYYTFTLGARPPGTVMDIEIKTIGGAPNTNNYLWFTGFVNPFAECVGPKNQKRLVPCDVTRGGTYSLAVERTQNNQQYSMRLYYTNGINANLAENVPAPGLIGAVGDEIYFRYTVPAGAVGQTANTQSQIFFILDNVVGGVVEIKPLFNQNAGTQCAGGSACSSIEGCHINVPYCAVQQGFYTVVAKAIVVLQTYIPVTFNVRAYVKTYDITPNTYAAGRNVRSSIFLNDYTPFKFTLPQQANIGDWLDIELYVDSDLQDRLPVTVFVGTTPFPQNTTYGCAQNFYLKCDAYIEIGNQRFCYLQLDPCDLELFTNGVYVTVFANNQFSVVNNNQEHTYLQNPLDFTIYTKIRNPNKNLIQHGTVITDEVTEGWKRAYRIDDTVRSGALEIAISANYHYVFAQGNALVIQNDTARIELDVDIVYSQTPYIGPNCLTCYRVQSSFHVSLRALETYKFIHRKCVQGFEHVYLVITGNNTLSRTNTTLFNFTDNRYVITAKNTDVIPAESIRPGEFSNIISKDSAFGGVQYWKLNFDRKLLANSTMSLKLRAHPRSGRYMTLTINDGFDPDCAPANFPSVCGGATPGLTFTCGVNNTNKGYCYINIQTCFLLPNANRTFVVEVRSFNRPNLTVPDVEVEFAYSFTYDLIPNVATAVSLGQNTQIIVDLEAEIYQHFKVDVPAASVGRDSLIFEAYFDSNNLYATRLPILLYVNAPSSNKNGLILAGNPVTSAQCLCFTDVSSDINKVVRVFDRCEIEAGTYYFSVFTNSFGFKEGASHVTIKVYTIPYVQPIPYENHLDLSLFPTQTAAYQITVDSSMLTDNTRTDKELQIWAETNIAQYNASIEIRLANAIATCGCGSALTDVIYECAVNREDGRATQTGRCDIISGMCNLAAGNWYILTRVIQPNVNRPVDQHQVVPFSLTATKLNTITTVRRLTLKLSATCDFGERTSVISTNSLKTEEYIFFDVRGQNTDGFSLYFDNITNGFLEVFTGIGYLPTVNCTISTTVCPETPAGGGPPCVITFSGCTLTEYIGVKAVSNKKNLETFFQAASCLINTVANGVSTLTFNDLKGVIPVIALNGAQPVTFTIPTLQSAQVPMVIVTVQTQNLGGGDLFTATMSRPTCATCGGSFSATCTNNGRNCTIYVPFCDLPSDYATNNWQILVSNRAATNGFYVAVFAINNNIGNINLPTNQLSSFNIQPLSWTNVIWDISLTNGLAPVGTATQASSILFQTIAGPGLVKYINAQDGFSCLAPFTNTTFNFTSCCTTAISRVYSFFNQDFTNLATIEITPTIQTHTQNWTKYTWPNGAPSVTQAVLAPSTSNGQTRIVEYYAAFPGVKQFGSYVFQANTQSGVNVYIKGNLLAGPTTGKGGCLDNDVAPANAGGLSYYSRIACATSTLPLTSSSSDPYFPQLVWTAFENTGGADVNGQFNWTIINPVQVFNNSISSPVQSWRTANQQFFYVPGPNVAYKNRVFRISLNVIAGTVVMYANRKSAAGPATNCTGQIIAPTAATSTTAILNVPSCPASNDILWVGVVTQSDSSIFTVTVTEINTLIDANTPAEPLAPFVPLVRSGALNYDVTFGSIPQYSYLRVNINNITLGSQFVISIYRDGSCQNFDDSTFGTWCGEPNNLGWRCTNILPGCQLQPNVPIHIEISGSGAGQTYTIQAEIITFGNGGLPITPIAAPAGRPGERLQALTASSILPHDIQLYKVTIPARSVLPGENIRVYMDSGDCGSVDSWGAVGTYPGPFCNAKNTFCATTADCLITSYQQCQEYDASSATLLGQTTQWSTDIYVLVRGKAHSEANVAMRFNFRVERDGSYDVRHMYYLEKHFILPVAPTPASAVQPVSCPVTNVPNVSTCCPGAAAISGSWIWQPTVFHFPVEGAQFLNDQYFQRLTLSIDNRWAPFIQSADLRVWNQQPSFCGGIDVPNRVANPGQFTRCSVTQAKPNCTVNLYIPFCGLVDSHLMFFTVDNLQFTPGALPFTIAGFGIGASLSHTRIPNTIIPVPFNTTRRYIEGDLSRGQFHYFKVFHDQIARNNYHFNVQVLSVTGGTLALHHHWTGCPNTTVCSVTNCADTDPRVLNQSANCKVLPDCACNYEQIICRTGDMNSAPVREGFFTLEGAFVQSGFDVLHYVLEITFLEPLIAISDITCGNETCEEERYYNQVPAAGPEELYRFRLTSVNGKSNILIANDGVIGLDGYDNPVQPASCQKRRVCDSLVDGKLEQCVTFYRTPEDLAPFVSVHTTGTCTNSLLTRFNLNPDKYTPPIVTIQDGIKYDSQYFAQVKGCSQLNQTYWYKVQLTKGSYYVAELWSASAERMQLWVTKNHISWHAFGEALNIGCQTNTTGSLNGGGQYCRYIVACNFSTGLYYIQVSDSNPLPKLHAPFRHQIRVTTMDPINTPLNFGSDLTFLIPEDLRQIQTITVTGVSGNQVQPWQELTLYWASQRLTYNWLNRNKFGDITCAVDSDVDRNLNHKLKVPECQVDAQNGVFVAHFMLSTLADCASSRVVSVVSRFNSPGVAIAQTNQVNTATQMSIVPGGTLYIKHSLGAPLGANQIAYHRLSNFDQQTRLTSTIWKGNHLNTDRSTYALPCNPACSQGIREASTSVSWGDVCWHCGGVYDTVFAQVDALAYTGNTSLLNTVAFTSTLSVVTPTALSATAAPFTLDASEPQLQFFSAPYPRDRGSRIELVIAKGGSEGLEINVYAQDCGLRTLPTQYWCFAGHFCSIPVPENHNFGSHYTFVDQTSPYISPNLLIVVRGQDASYTISQVQNTASCGTMTTANAPFCASYGTSLTSRTYWGNTNTFLQKDANAREFYYNLTIAFSCPNGGVDHCQCAPLSVPCRNNLAIYACLSIFNPCDSAGLEVQPTKTDCDAVENTCPKTFRCAGYPERSCGASFYYVPPAPTAAPTANGTTLRPSGAPTAATEAPTNEPTVLPPSNLPPSFITGPTEEPTFPANSGGFPAWVPGVVIFLIVLVALLLVAVVVGAVLLATGAAGSAAPSEIDAYQIL